MEREKQKNVTGRGKTRGTNKSMKSYLAPAAVNLSVSVDEVSRDQQGKIERVFLRTDHTLQL